jgi:hypothetical protein
MYSNSKEQISLEEAYRMVHLEKKEEECECGCDKDCEECDKCDCCKGKEKDLEESVTLNETGMIHDYLMSLSDSSLDRLLFWVATVSGIVGGSATAGIQALISHFKDKAYLNKFLNEHPKIKKDYQELLKVEKEFEKYKDLELHDRHIDLKTKKNALLHMIEIRLAGVVAKAGHGSEVGEFTDKLLELIQKKINESK